jgi:hypothetical protein
MQLRLTAAAALLCVGVWAQPGVSVAQIKEFLQSAKQLKQQDKDVAATLRTMRLKERLDARTIEELQGEGAGPKTIAALRELATASASLPVARPPAPKPEYVPPPPPSSEQQAKILDAVREYANNYTKTLPDFICAQVTRREYDPSGTETWHPADVILTRLSYFDQKEDYKVVSINNHVVTDKAFTSVGGAISQGEFGSMMREIFDRNSHTEFSWERWTKLRKRMAYVFSYQVPLAYSQYTIHYQAESQDKGQTVTAGYHGSIFIDKETNTVLRIDLNADSIPPSFPVQQAKTLLDYDFQTIGDREFLLPMRADVRMRASKFLTKNEVEFRNYRKFSADTTLKFDEELPAPLPESKTKEQPPPK